MSQMVCVSSLPECFVFVSTASAATSFCRLSVVFRRHGEVM